MLTKHKAEKADPSFHPFIDPFGSATSRLFSAKQYRSTLRRQLAFFTVINQSSFVGVMSYYSGYYARLVSLLAATEGGVMRWRVKVKSSFIANLTPDTAAE